MKSFCNTFCRHSCTLLLFIVLFCLPAAAKAQLDGGILAGGSVYAGDIGPDRLDDYVRQMRLTYGIFLRLELSRQLAVRIQFEDLDLYGDDDLSIRTSRRARNFNFYTDVNELSLQFEWHPLADKWMVSPYLIGGVAVYQFNPLAIDNNGEVTPLQPLGTEGQGLSDFDEPYDLTRIAVPLGAGIRFPMGKSFFFSLQASGRLTFFDHLDDISGAEYVNEGILEANGPLAVELAYRGDEVPGTTVLNAPANTPRGGLANDFYYSISGQLSYQITKNTFSFIKGRKKRIPCPSF